jgi:hypothetical protein
VASTALVKDVLWRVSVLLQDTAPQFQRWPERELVQWLNDAQNAIVKYLPMSSTRVDAIRLAPGTRQTIASIPAANVLPGDGSVPTAPINGKLLLGPRRNMGGNGTTPGRAIRMVERDVLDSQDQDWHTRTGPRVDSIIYDPQSPRYFYVTPCVPLSPQVWVEIAYTSDPVAIPAGGLPASEVYRYDGASTAVITVEDEMVEELADYVVARANLKDTKYAEPARAQLHTARFLASLNAKVAANMGTDPNITLLPGVTQPAQR